MQRASAEQLQGCLAKIGNWLNVLFIFVLEAVKSCLLVQL